MLVKRWSSSADLQGLLLSLLFIIDEWVALAARNWTVILDLWQPNICFHLRKHFKNWEKLFPQILLSADLMDVYPFVVLTIINLQQQNVEWGCKSQSVSLLITKLCSPPSSCPAGTCDGCTFYFVWESAEACPLCTEQDYHEIEGACKKGFQVQVPCLQVTWIDLGLTWTLLKFGVQTDT